MADIQSLTTEIRRGK